MRSVIILVSVVILSVLTTCKKIDVKSDTPACIKNKIRTEMKNTCLDKVYSCEYEGRTLYFFIYPCPEGCYRLFDSDCNDVTNSDGNSVCGCTWGGAFCDEDFWNNKTNEQLIWQKE